MLDNAINFLCNQYWVSSLYKINSWKDQTKWAQLFLRLKSCLYFRPMRCAKLKLKWSSWWVRVTGVHATCKCCSYCRSQRVDAKLILKCPQAFDVTQSQKKTTEVMTPPDTLSHSTCFLPLPAPPLLRHFYLCKIPIKQMPKLLHAKQSQRCVEPKLLHAHKEHSAKIET